MGPPCGAPCRAVRRPFARCSARRAHIAFRSSTPTTISVPWRSDAMALIAHCTQPQRAGAALVKQLVPRGPRRDHPQAPPLRVLRHASRSAARRPQDRHPVAGGHVGGELRVDDSLRRTHTRLQPGDTGRHHGGCFEACAARHTHGPQGRARRARSRARQLTALCIGKTQIGTVPVVRFRTPASAGIEPAELACADCPADGAHARSAPHQLNGRLAMLTSKTILFLAIAGASSRGRSRAD